VTGTLGMLALLAPFVVILALLVRHIRDGDDA
jgi:hypothetical protein